MVIAFLKMSPFHHKFRPKDTEIFERGGEYNGYVAFDAVLPLSYQGGADYTSNIADVLDGMIDVHGGITLDCSMEDMIEDPMIPLTAMPAPKELKKYRCIGFDTLHWNDTREKWSIEAVKKETLNLMKQIETIIAEQK